MDARFKAAARSKDGTVLIGHWIWKGGGNLLRKRHAPRRETDFQ